MFYFQNWFISVYSMTMNINSGVTRASWYLTCDTIDSLEGGRLADLRELGSTEAVGSSSSSAT